MKLYYAPGACSLADHIALQEAGLSFERVKVDIPTRTMEDGGDFTRVNPKGYVPALEFDGGEILTENAAILSWIAEQAPSLAPDGALGRIRLIEMLSFIASEVHKPFIRAMFPTADADRDAARKIIEGRFDLIAGRLGGDYLFGERFSAADAYLFVMLRWAQGMNIELPERLRDLLERVNARPAVRQALRAEGLG
jgi:glutathione S-transferase